MSKNVRFIVKTAEKTNSLCDNVGDLLVRFCSIYPEAGGKRLRNPKRRYKYVEDTVQGTREFIFEIA